MVEFLDLQIMIEDKKLETNMFIKPSNQQLYLDFFSNHPNPCKEGVVFGQALQILERCSKPEDTEKHLENLKTKLKNRNYPENLIDGKIEKAKKKPRHDLIQQKRKSKNKKDDKIRMIFTQNSANPPLNMWLREATKMPGEKLESKTNEGKYANMF